MPMIAFDQFVFDTETLELSKGDQRVDLAPKPGQLLKALIAAAPGIVTREEARQLLWPQGQYAEPEQGINACVRQLRAALGDEASSSEFIETLPKRGYRLKATFSQSGQTKPNLLAARMLVVAGAFVFVGTMAALLFWNAYIAHDDISSVAELDATSAELTARAEALRMRHEGDDRESALGLYEQIIAEHPRAAPALAGKAIVLAKLAGQPGYPRQEIFAKALEFSAASDSVSLLPDAAAARGYVMLYRDLDPAAALPEFEEAVTRDGNHAESYVGMAAALSALGRTTDAIEASTTAAHINPLSYSARSDRCWYLLFDDRLEEALVACNWATEIDADHTFSYLGIALAVKGDQSRMQTAMQNYFEAQGLQYEDGDIENGAFTCRLAERMARLPEEHAVSPYEVATFYGLCNDADKTQVWLDRAIQRRQTAVLYFLYDPRFDTVRSRMTEFDINAGLTASPDTSS